MRHYWLNRQGNDKLILFFAGWGFDQNPFKFFNCADYDVLMFYDYGQEGKLLCPPLEGGPEFLQQQFEQKFRGGDNLSGYKEFNLIAWSMGVFVAEKFFDEDLFFSRKIAINGTPFPVHDEWGIPEKIFELTLKHARTGLEGKFYKNVFGEDFERYMLNPVTRTVENRVEELESLYKLIKSGEITEKNQFLYDTAIISTDDKIFPAKSQLAFWEGKTECKTVAAGHFPFYNYKSWAEILDEAKHKNN